MSTLTHEVAKFRDWAATRGPGEHAEAEWECDYPDWQTLYAAINDFLTASTQRTVTPAELQLLLYVLARDSEDEIVLETLEKFPSIAVQVIEAAVSFHDEAARWQAAVLAGRIGSASMLHRFLNDEAEYVRRRAGFALQEMEGGA